MLSLHHNKITELPFIMKPCLLFNTNCDVSKRHLQPANDVPPPTPPRMPTMFQMPTTKSNRPNSGAILQPKRPAPSPPPLPSRVLMSTSLPPPPLQFLSRAEKEHLISMRSPPIHNTATIPPPIPPMPPHLLRSQANINRLRSKYEKRADDDYYEECGIDRDQHTVYQLEVLLLHHNRLNELPCRLIQLTKKLVHEYHTSVNYTFCFRMNN